MGASLSTTFLYKIVSTIEIISSIVITIFGVRTYFLFQETSDVFREEKKMIEYASTVAVVQSVLTILVSFLLVAFHHSTLRYEAQWSKNPLEIKRPNQLANIGRRNSLRRRAIAPSWISWTLISIACLLFVFVSPMEYCIQDENEEQSQNLPTSYGAGGKLAKRSDCLSTSQELIPIRSSLSDLYSFSLIGILFKMLFVFVMYKNWRRAIENAKKIIIYVEACDPIDEYQYEGNPQVVISPVFVPTDEDMMKGIEPTDDVIEGKPPIVEYTQQA